MTPAKESGMASIARLAKDEAGATAIEYGLIAALIALGIIGSLVALSGNVGNMFNLITDGVTTSM
jgi:pilus assembly protein Flp/PilA